MGNLCIIIRDQLVHQFLGHCLIPLDPCGKIQILSVLSLKTPETTNPHVLQFFIPVLSFVGLIKTLDLLIIKSL